MRRREFISGLAASPLAGGRSSRRAGCRLSQPGIAPDGLSWPSSREPTSYAPKYAGQPGRQLVPRAGDAGMNGAPAETA